MSAGRDLQYRDYIIFEGKENSKAIPGVKSVSQEFLQGLKCLFWLFFHYPVPAVFQHDRRDVSSHKFSLCNQ